VRARIAASVALAAALLLGTSGCTFFTAQSTTKAYDASDGVSAAVGNIKAENAILISTDGQQASLLINLINDGEAPVSVKIQYTGTEGSVTTHYNLAGREAVTFGKKNTPKIIFENINTEPGALFPVFIQYGTKTGQQMLVPVLNGSQAEYAGLAPTMKPTPSATPSSSASAAPSASASASPAPSASPSN
jgi:hypothetical protein